MLSEIGSVDNIPEFIEGVKNRFGSSSDFLLVAASYGAKCQQLTSLYNAMIYRKRKMSGFGHRVYKNYDPRAKVIKKLAEEVFSIVGRDPLIEVCFVYSYS